MNFSTKIKLIFEDQAQSFDFEKDYDKIKSIIKRDCSQYLAKYKKPLYRIMPFRSTSDKGSFFRKEIRKDRRPKDTGQIIDLLINKFLEANKLPKRSETAFCYADLQAIEHFQSISPETFLRYMIFPINGDQTFVYFKGIHDLTQQFDLAMYGSIEFPIELKQKSFDEIWKYLWEYFDDELPGQKRNLEKMFTMLKTNAIVNNLSKVIDEEILFKGAAYYALLIPENIDDSPEKEYYEKALALYEL